MKFIYHLIKIKSHIYFLFKGCFTFGFIFPDNNSSILIPNSFASKGKIEISGAVSPRSHLETELPPTPSLFPNSS